MKYSVITFGCRVNQADSLGFEEGLMAAGASPAPSEEADLIVVNTCSVTASADQGARQTIRRMARVNPSARIVVTGCYATRRPDEVAALPGVERVLPNGEKPNLSTLFGGRSLLRGIRLQPDGVQFQPDPNEPTTAQRFGNGEGGCGAVISPGVGGRTAFTLRVQTGCAEPCTYCIIPTTRGAPRSVPVGSVLAEATRVSSAGFKEIALTGVHLGSYGRDLRPAASLVELLEALSSAPFGDPMVHEPTRSAWDALDTDPARVEESCVAEGCDAQRGRPLFRISSLEPMDCTTEIVSIVAERDCFAPHFHLPLQHGSNRVLAAMRRPYTIEQYAELVEHIRRRIPAAAIGSDVIVGFPGETDRDFEQLADFLERSPLTHIHVFPYSDRPGTPATMMPGKVPGAVVRERARRVREISDGLNRRFRDAQVGTVLRGLTLEDGSVAVTGNYLKLRIPPVVVRNQWVLVRVASHHHGELLGG